MRSGVEIFAATAAAQRASRTSFGSAPLMRAIAPITAAAPPIPPTKKYVGISHVQTGSLITGCP